LGLLSVRNDELLLETLGFDVGMEIDVMGIMHELGILWGIDEVRKICSQIFAIVMRRVLFAYAVSLLIK
jgi:hypothetical protein